ncbi:MAG: histidine phosphatase family protein [Pyrinomonadaceae bacterium]
MKTLLLLRHAKSDWGQPGRRDFVRPLNKRGLRDAPLVGAFLHSQRIRPDLLLCSPAERARMTASLVAGSAQLRIEPRFDERIYEASAASLVEVIREVEDKAHVVLLVGHNPGLSDLIAKLTGEVRHMATAALARITLEVEHWSEAEREGNCLLEWLIKADASDDD